MACFLFTFGGCCIKHGFGLLGVFVGLLHRLHHFIPVALEVTFNWHSLSLYSPQPGVGLLSRCGSVARGGGEDGIGAPLFIFTLEARRNGVADCRETGVFGAHGFTSTTLTA